jgi:hypothetical protein
MTEPTWGGVGVRGVERAAVWSATGFALSLGTFGAAGAAGTPSPTTVTAVCLGLVAVGVVGFARGGGDAAPSLLLAYGPTAAVAFATVGPAVRVGAGEGVGLVGAGAGGAARTAVALAEPFAVAAAGAVVLGGGAFLVGRGLAALGRASGDDVGARSGDAGGGD